MNKSKFLRLCISIIFIIISLSVFVLSGSGGYYFQNFNEWNDIFSGRLDDFFGSTPSIWSNFDDDAHSTLGWYPVHDWEIDVCSNVFTTDFTPSDYTYYDPTVSYDGRNYAMTVAISPLLREQEYTDEDGDDVYLFTLGWYLQGITEDTISYKLKIISDDGNFFLDLGEGEEEKEFSLSTGTSGFYSNYTSYCIRKVELTIDDSIYDTYDVFCENINLEQNCSFCSS